MASMVHHCSQDQGGGGLGVRKYNGKHGTNTVHGMMGKRGWAGLLEDRSVGRIWPGPNPYRRFAPVKAAPLRRCPRGGGDKS
eukprot:scaffold25689_cov118-Isochrysis_galbana.AAC.4